jgi:hypothetical protein
MALANGPVTAPSVEDLVDAHRRRSDESSTEDAIFGPVGVKGVAGWYERVCSKALGAPVRRALFFAASAGCVAGVELADGRQLVIKAYQRRWRLDLLRVVWSAQRRLVATGFACPVPEVAPFSFEGLSVSVERLLADPGVRVLDPDEMSVSAESLATAAITLRGENASPWVGMHAMDRPSGSLYPVPHSPLFDFNLNAEEAGWIDELASAGLAAQELDDSPPQMLHGDWSARNIRVVGGRLVASYDWDSLGAFKESLAVGVAAATWRSIGEAHDPAAPDTMEIEAYLDAYTCAADGSRGRRWRTAAMGSALYALAYTARCEHSRQARDPRQQPRRARETLQADRRRFLAMVELH